jgi:hypothetical protein
VDKLPSDNAMGMYPCMSKKLTQWGPERCSFLRLPSPGYGEPSLVGSSPDDSCAALSPRELVLHLLKPFLLYGNGIQGHENYA